jgi:hypothetical protein
VLLRMAAGAAFAADKVTGGLNLRGKCQPEDKECAQHGVNTSA